MPTASCWLSAPKRARSFRPPIWRRADCAGPRKSNRFSERIVRKIKALQRPLRVRKDARRCSVAVWPPYLSVTTGLVWGNRHVRKPDRPSRDHRAIRHYLAPAEPHRPDRARTWCAAQPRAFGRACGPAAGQAGRTGRKRQQASRRGSWGRDRYCPVIGGRG